MEQKTSCTTSLEISTTYQVVFYNIFRAYCMDQANPLTFKCVYWCHCKTRPIATLGVELVRALHHHQEPAIIDQLHKYLIDISHSNCEMATTNVKQLTDYGLVDRVVQY